MERIYHIFISENIHSDPEIREKSHILDKSVSFSEYKMIYISKLILRPNRQTADFSNNVHCTHFSEEEKIKVNWLQMGNTFREHPSITYNIWEILTSHNIIRPPNYIKGGFTFALISYPADETFSNLTWRLFSILSIYDYRWVEIAYGLEKIVLMPQTWSVRIFAKKTACLVT